MLRRPRLDIGVAHLVERLVAEIGMQQLVVVAHGLDQPRAIGVAIDAVQRLALLARAVEDFAEHRIVAGQDAALEISLLPREVAHPACLPKSLPNWARTFPAISRVRFTSRSSSSSGGMLSSRSIMVETRPKRLMAAT